MKLFARPGWGSAIIDYQLALYGLPVERIEVEDLFDPARGAAGVPRDRLVAVNPRGQIPTLLLDDGQVLTESAAITLSLADRTGSDRLVPGPGDPLRRTFLRWLVFLVANIYPCFTFADDPARFVAEPAARQPFRQAVNAHAETLWREVEAVAHEPWFLGERLSAIDCYLAVMMRWRPGLPWFEAEAPKIAAAGRRLEALPELAAAVAANRDPLLS